MTLLVTFLLLVPIIIYSLYDIRKDIKKGESKKEIISSGFIWLIFVISASFSYFTYKINIIYGVFQYLIPLMVVILLILEEKYELLEKSQKTILHKEFVILVLISFVSPFVMLFVAVPIAVIPYFDNVPNVNEITADKISPVPIVTNLARIKDSIEELEKQLMIESQSIDTLSDAVVEELERHSNELEDLKKEQAEVMTQLEYYKSLTSLTEDQTQSVVSALNRSRYVDYLVGFGIGILTGGFFIVLQNYYFRKYFRNSKSSKEN